MRALALALILLALPAPAQERLRSLETGDAGRGWDAVGKLMLGERGFCTGALIRPDLVLTAAHCLFDRGARIEAGALEFRAGWRNGRATAYRHVRRATVHPDYVHDETDAAARVGSDLALLELDQPIRLPSVTPFAVDRPPPAGGRVGLVSYALGRAEAPSLQEVCRILGRMPGALVLSCSVDFGASGAPVFALEGGAARIVSVVSAKAEMDGAPVALGIDIARPLADLLAGLAAAPDVVGQAKFLRP